MELQEAQGSRAAAGGHLLSPEQILANLHPFLVELKCRGDEDFVDENCAICLAELEKDEQVGVRST